MHRSAGGRHLIRKRGLWVCYSRLHATRHRRAWEGARFERTAPAEAPLAAFLFNATNVL